MMQVKQLILLHSIEVIGDFVNMPTIRGIKQLRIIKSGGGFDPTSLFQSGDTGVFIDWKYGRSNIYTGYPSPVLWDGTSESGISRVDPMAANTAWIIESTNADDKIIPAGDSSYFLKRTTVGWNSGTRANTFGRDKFQMTMCTAARLDENDLAYFEPLRVNNLQSGLALFVIAHETWQGNNTVTFGARKQGPGGMYPFLINYNSPYASNTANADVITTVTVDWRANTVSVRVNGVETWGLGGLPGENTENAAMLSNNQIGFGVGININSVRYRNRIYAQFLIDRVLTSTERTNLENWMIQRTEQKTPF